MNRALVSLLALVALATSASAATFEVPGDGGKASGIGYLSGWKCPPNDNITLVLDGGAPIPVPSRVRRNDTAGVCNNDGRNGYITQFNFGLLGDGAHTASLRQNGVQFAGGTFTVVTFGQPFLSGASGLYELPNFPSAGQTATVQWVQGAQNFVIVGKSGGGSGGLPGLLGTWDFTFRLFGSTFTYRYRLQSIQTADGIDAIVGRDQQNDLVVAGKIQDIDPGNPLPYEFALLEFDDLVCEFYVFNRTGNAVAGLHADADGSPSGDCSDFLGEDPFTGVRISNTATLSAESVAKQGVARERSEGGPGELNALARRMLESR